MDLIDLVLDTGEAILIVASQSRSSNPRPRSDARAGGSHAEGTGEELFLDGCVAVDDERPFSEPMERNAFSFLPAPELPGRSPWVEFVG